MRAEDWLKSLGRPETYRGVFRRDRSIAPTVAIRECLVNAVAHRDYTIMGSKIMMEVFDDRVVVMSPGPLPNHKRVESVLAGGAPRSRNELIANFMLDQKLMEKRGSGYPRIKRAMSEFNDTAPTLVNNPEERWLQVTLWRTQRGASS